MFKLPFKILSRSRYDTLKLQSKGGPLIDRLMPLFDAEGAEPRLLRSEFLARVTSSRPAVLLDVGANVGLWTRCMANRFPSCSIHSVEADPRTAGVLRKNVKSLSNVTVHELAMHSESGRIRFRSNKNPLLSSVLELEDARGVTESIEVEAITLDELVRSRLCECPSIVKIDTEGNDLQVLAGATLTLADPRLRVVIMEFGFDPSLRRQVVLQELLEVMAARQFRLREIDLAGIYNAALYGNAMFCRMGD